MAKFRVSGAVSLWCSIVVEAEDPASAVDAAGDQWPGLTNYAGNGAISGRLVGHAEDNVEITAPDETPDWEEDDVEEVFDA